MRAEEALGMTRDDITASGHSLGYELDRYHEIAEDLVRYDLMGQPAPSATEYCALVERRMERQPGFPGWPSSRRG